MDAVQSRTVHGDLVINLRNKLLAYMNKKYNEDTRSITYLVSLFINVYKELVLRLDFFAHGTTESVETLRSTMQSIQIGVDLVLHIIILRVGFELVLGSVGKRRLLCRSTGAFKISVNGFAAGGRLPGCFPGGVASITIAAVGFHDLGVALFATGLGCEGVGNVTVGLLLAGKENEEDGLSYTANMDLLRVLSSRAFSSAMRFWDDARSRFFSVL